MTVRTPEWRTTELARNLAIASDLIGDDPINVHPEYIRALSEHTCIASGVNSEHKEAVADLLIGLGQTNDPVRNAHALAQDLAASADLIGNDIHLATTNRPEYIRALSEHACFMADISGDHADSVQDVLIGILTSD